MHKKIDMAKNTSISLGNHFEDFMSIQLTTGRFNNASEIIRAGLRLLEIEENKYKVLKNALEDGEKSEKIKDFDSKQHLKELHTKHL